MKTNSQFTKVILLIIGVFVLSLSIPDNLYAQIEEKDLATGQTQGEFAIQLVKALGWDMDFPPTATTEEYINILKEVGIEPPGGFQPEKPIAKEDRMMLLSKALSIEETGIPEEKGIFYRDTAVITKISGDVKIKRGESGQWIKAEEGMKLSENDSIKTSKDSFVHLNVGLAGRIKVKEDTELLLKTLSSEAGKHIETICLYLAMGELIIDARDIKEASTFDTVTPTTIAGVRGTIYSVKVLESKTIVK